MHITKINLDPNSSFNDYTIINPIGEGGIGKVYLAFDNSLEREVAIKIISNEHGETTERFIREAKLTASIQHPNIVNIYKVGKKETFLYIVMEYVNGSTVDERLGNGPFKEKAAWRIILQTCLGLRKALRNGIIHRDIKPGNIILQGDNAVLTDFGLSKKVNDDDNVTQIGIIMGTPGYISPEQVASENVGFPSDIYSLGATAYHMLTGKRTFVCDSVFDTMSKHKFEKPDSPKKHVPSLSNNSCKILAKMLAKSPSDRYLSYGDLIFDIHCLLENNSVVFASNRDVANHFTRDIGTDKKSITQSIFSMFSTKKDTDKKPFLYLTGEDSFAIEEGKQPFHIAFSEEELKSLKEINFSHVVANAESLGVYLVDLLVFLKNNFSKLPIFILMSKKSKLSQKTKFAKCFIDQSQMYSFVSASGEGLVFLEDIDLSLIFEIISHFQWTTRITTEDAQDLFFKSGRLVSVLGGDCYDNPAFDTMQKVTSWKLASSLGSTTTISQKDTKRSATHQENSVKVYDSRIESALKNSILFGESEQFTSKNERESKKIEDLMNKMFAKLEDSLV